jgi:hypothetical protein
VTERRVIGDRGAMSCRQSAVNRAIDVSRSSASPMPAQAGGPRPDPALGVFETLLIVAGRPLELEGHLARLDASLRALFGAPAPPGAGELVRDHARGRDFARLRLTVAPSPDGGSRPTSGSPPSTRLCSSRPGIAASSSHRSSSPAGSAPTSGPTAGCWSGQKPTSAGA